MMLPRAWHTATVLADGTVLVAGGRNGNAMVSIPELFDPATPNLYDRAVPRNEITNFREGLANCKTIFNKRCKRELQTSSPSTPEQQVEIAKLLTASAILRM